MRFEIGIIQALADELAKLAAAPSGVFRTIMPHTLESKALKKGLESRGIRMARGPGFLSRMMQGIKGLRKAPSSLITPRKSVSRPSSLLGSLSELDKLPSGLLEKTSGDFWTFLGNRGILRKRFPQEWRKSTADTLRILRKDSPESAKGLLRNTRYIASRGLYDEPYGGVEKKAAFNVFIDELDKIASLGAPKGHPDYKTFKKHGVPLTPEERKAVMDAKAVWHHGKRGAPTPAVSKAVIDGKTWFETHTHRALNYAPSLKGAISRYHRFIKSTA